MTNGRTGRGKRSNLFTIMLKSRGRDVTLIGLSKQNLTAALACMEKPANTVGLYMRTGFNALGTE